jgi:L-fucose isomerase-like protein
MGKLKVALLAGSMPYFSDEGKLIYKKACTDLQELSKRLGFSLKIYPDFIMSEEKAMEVRKEIDNTGIDYMLLFHPTYISGDIVFELLKTKVKVGLWGTKEPKKKGPLPLASLICLNQNTSIAGHYFKDRNIKFKWFFGEVDNIYFEPRFEVTVKALSAIKALKDSKVAQIGRIAEGFRNMYYDGREIYKTLGVDIVRDIEIEDILSETEKLDDKKIREEMDKIYPKISRIEVDERKIVDSVKIFIATKKICEENNYKAVAFDCAAKLIKLKGMIACLSNSLLNSYGITAGCEGDMLSTISALILKLLSEKTTLVSDMAAFDEKDESLLLWHCGSAPMEMANSDGVCCRNVYRSEFASGTELEDLGPITDITYPETDATVFRLTGESDMFYYFTGRTFNAEKDSWYGNRGWLGKIKLYREPVKVIDLMNTIFINSIQHHYPIVLQNVSDYIEEFAYWLDLKKIKKVGYERFMHV